MGAYLSIPYVSRKVVQLEQGKPEVKEENVEVIEEVIEEVSPMMLTIPETIPDLSSTIEDEVKTKRPSTPVMSHKEIVDFPPKLTILIPESIVEAPHDRESPVARIPEFQGNTNSESLAIKKFNRRHRKHAK